MTVLFIRLLLDLESPNIATVEQTHAALLAIQNAVYAKKGTLRQFLQVCVCVWPFACAHSLCRCAWQQMSCMGTVCECMYTQTELWLLDSLFL
jgi:hypothetical protein